MEEVIKLKTFKTHRETLCDKPEEHILNIIVQGSDNKTLLIKIVFNEGKHKIVLIIIVLYTNR